MAGDSYFVVLMWFQLGIFKLVRTEKVPQLDFTVDED